MNQTFNIEGMSCEGCANAVTAKLKSDDRITEASVDLDSEQASLQSDTELLVSDINDLLADTPYSATANN